MKTVSLNPVPGTRTLAILWLAVFGLSAMAASPSTEAMNVNTPPASAAKCAYAGNRAPLEPSPFVKLPIGSIEARGWLRHQLELEARGMTGHLEEISKW